MDILASDINQVRDQAMFKTVHMNVHT